MDTIQQNTGVTIPNTTHNSDPLHDTDRARHYLDNQNPPSKVTMERWRREGNGPSFVQMGKLIRYRQSSLDQYIEACTRSPRSRALRK